MEIKYTRMISRLAVIAGFLTLLPLAGKAWAASSTPPLPPNTPKANEAPDVTRRVDCDSGQTIQQAVDNSNNGDAVLVSGTCNENVSVGDGRTRVTLDGQGTATVDGSGNPASATITVRGRNITIRNFTISGGRDGIVVNRGGTATITGNTITGALRDGVTINRDAEATVDGNTIQNTGRFGVNFDQNGTGRVVNNMIQNNASDGILVDESSSARVGFLSFSDTTPGPNTIQNNGRDGVHVIRSASAIILSNTISNNALWGIRVERVSHADIGANTINANGVGGILFRENSAVNLGQTGLPFDASNSTTVLNTGPGLRCREGGVARGSRGTLNGTTGPTDFGTFGTVLSDNCTDRTTP